MIGFNRFKSKVKNVPIIPSFLKNSEKDLKTNTLHKKSFFQNKKILVIGNKGDFLSNLFATVLHQYEPSIKLVSICNNSNFSNNNNNGSSKSNGNDYILNDSKDIIENLELNFELQDRNIIQSNIKAIIKDYEILVICFEWCEFSELYRKLDLLSRSCHSLNGDGGENSTTTGIKKIIVTFPIGVEDSQFQFEQNTSIETLFSPISTIFLFYSSLMQWLFVGPPTYINLQSQQHFIQLPISKPDDEGCFWLDCDDLIKVMVDLLLTIEGIKENKMYVLTGKECLTSKEISTILFNEFKIIVEDCCTSDNNSNNTKKKFYNYLSSPISLLSSPDIEILLNNTPNTFSNFLRKCSETQSFISIYKTRSRSNSRNSSTITVTTTTISNNTTTTTTTTSTNNNINNSSNVGSPSSTLTSSISNVSSSAYKFVFGSLNFLKYSKDFIEDTIYKSPTAPTTIKKTNLPEITQYLSLLNESFKKVYIDNKIEQKQQIIENSDNNINTGDSNSNSSSPKLHNNIITIEFLAEDYVEEVQYEITVLNPLIQPEPQVWELSVLSPKVFQSIRDTYRIKDFLLSPDDLKEIVSFMEVETIGRSGSFFFKSIDERYFIKTIPSNEYDTFVKLFQSYHQHIVKYQSTLLPRFYGYYKLKGKLKAYNIYGTETYQQREIIFCVMSNLFYSNDPKLFINEKYDLKGSTIGRYVNNEIISSNESDDQEIFTPTLKDLNLKRRFYLGKNKKLFMAQIQADTEWMLSHGICDYSLLVGIHLPTPKELAECQSQTNTYSNSNYINDNKCDVSFFKQNNFGISSSVIKPLQLITIKKRSASLSTPININSSNSNTSSPGTSTSSNSSSSTGSKENLPRLPPSSTPPIPNYKTKPKTPLVLPNSNINPPSPNILPSPSSSISTNSPTSTNSPPLVNNSVPSPLNILNDYINTNTNSNANTVISTPPNTNNTNAEENINGIIYFFGLIDILTTYNLKKRGETALKSMVFDRTKISSINPTDYQSRFIKYIESTLE